MIVPTEGLKPDRALLTVAAQIIQVLGEPMTVSQSWEATRKLRNDVKSSSTISFDWFALGLDVLFALGLITFDGETMALTEWGE